MEQLEGFIATDTGETRVRVGIEGERATIRVSAAWMGREALECTLQCRVQVLGAHAGAFFVEGATGEGGVALELPASEGPIVVEYVRVPAQPSPIAGCDSMAEVGKWTDPFTMVLWVHREAAIDHHHDDEEHVDPVADALDWIHHPFKLA